MQAIEEVGRAISAVADSVGGSVVGIGHRWARGSGIVVGDGLVVTNAHNLGRDSTAVVFADGRTAAARLAGADVDGDIAVLETGTDGATTLPWAPDPPVLGTPVFALSNPGGRGLRVTFGFVSGTERSFRGPRGRRIAGSIEHTAPLLPGSSGGPVVDVHGRLLGINTNRLGEGFYLAIPADDGLRRRIDALAGGRAPRRVRIGVGIAAPEVARGLRRAVGLPPVDGLLIRVVEPGGPAARAGVEEGDLIVRAGGEPTASADDLYDVLDAVEPGQTLELGVIRGTEERTVTVRFEKDEQGAA